MSDLNWALAAPTISAVSVVMIFTVRLTLELMGMMFPMIKASTPANWPSFLALSGFTRPSDVSLCSAKMLFRFARSNTAKSCLPITKSTDNCSAMYRPSSLEPPCKSVKSSTVTFLLPCSLIWPARLSASLVSAVSMSGA